jgi:DNA modification methylase
MDLTTLNLKELSIFEHQSERLFRLNSLLKNELDFHGEDSGYSTHGLHAFPAKFPPQLPKKFIEELTKPGEVILDPMAGSGTTLVEAKLLKRVGIGFDIDPIAVLLSNVKTTTLKHSSAELLTYGNQIIRKARHQFLYEKEQMELEFFARFDKKTSGFIDYWFLPETKWHLFSLVLAFEEVLPPNLVPFFRVAFSNIIITKRGGVSLALDLAHTRPHKVKVARGTDGEFYFGEEVYDTLSDNKRRHTTKVIRSVYDSFSKSVEFCIKRISQLPISTSSILSAYGNAFSLPLKDFSVDFIFTSPPYASNAIDYMRAHKFSLIWFGFPIEYLSDHRKLYIGGESTKEFQFAKLTPTCEEVIQQISNIDNKKSQVIHRFYSEMLLMFSEIYRVLKKDRIAVIVIGNSIIKGVDIRVDQCLCEIAELVGFDHSIVGIRELDRDKRMLPVAAKKNLNSQIQQRMHNEFVIGIYKG